ncbi:uncharacterized protein Dvar_81170 [Desulfosarcina variabilis str. Montpellier]|uniref:hypothetical protein n=1 Tax=Desulfosarcina variabilis TaxID=2300 RepID=UPI003AFAF8CF
METINATNSMSNQVQGLERAPRVNEIKPEEEKTTGQQAAQAEDNPDYRVNLSEESRQRVAEMNSPMTAPQEGPEENMTEQEAAGLAEQMANQLSQTNVAIANEAMQKAMGIT